MGTTRQRVSIIFGLGGLLSGLIFSIVSAQYSFFPYSSRFTGLPLFLVWPFGLGASFWICETLGWTSVKPSLARLVTAFMLTTSATVCADLVPIFLGAATALLVPVQLHLGLVVAFGSGIFIAAALLWLAVSVLNDNFSRAAWNGFVLCALGLFIGTMIVQPGIFGFFGLSKPIIGERWVRLVEQTVLALHVFGYSVFGACAGYSLVEQKNICDVPACKTTVL
jgi:drug/metabolite transporter superfamily protein YnfA